LSDLEIIDCHTHVYQSADIGIREQQAMRGGAGESPERNGTAEEILRIMAETGVSKSVMLCYVPTTVMFQRGSQQLPGDPKERPGAIRDLRERIAGRVVRYNEWACETGKEHPDLLPFVGPDPFIMDRDFMVNELEDKLTKGAKGVKIVPQVLGIYLSDPRLWPIYDFCNRTGLPLMTQSGQGAGPVPPGDGFDSWGRPIYLKYALEEFKNLKVITAHFGRGYEEDIVELCQRYPGAYTDLSSQLSEWGEPEQWTVEEGTSLIRRAGVDKVLYGTNYPGSDPAKYVAKLKSLPLKDNELEKIASGNFKQLLNS
jgi:predicted TIM-barrel fold metal-dependent hydrolase